MSPETTAAELSGDLHSLRPAAGTAHHGGRILGRTRLAPQCRGSLPGARPKWSFLGYNGVVAAFLILGFYFVVSGWTAEYMVHSVTGSLARYTTADEYKSVFENFIQNPWRPVLYTALFVLATHFVIAMGVQKGIERSAKVLMPLLFVILIALSIHSLLMPGGEEGFGSCSGPTSRR